MHQTTEPTTQGSSLPLPGAGKRAGLTLKMSTVLFAVMTLAFIVAIIFAANSNTFVGWLVVIVAGGWLAIFAFLVFTLRQTARQAQKFIGQAQEDFSRQRSNAAPSAGVSVVSERDTMLDEKLSHSFKIIQVQRRVIAEELAKGQTADQETIERALETIEMTAHNGRDMIKGGSSEPDAETISGTVI